MQINRSKGSPIGVGVLTILTILLVLTLAMFAALTYSSARADLALSKKNAQTVTAYYAADTAAARMTQRFALGTQASLTATIPMTDMQSLYIHLQRTSGTHYKILAWNTVTKPQNFDPDSQTLPVFTGDPTQSAGGGAPVIVGSDPSAPPAQ